MRTNHSAFSNMNLEQCEQYEDKDKAAQRDIFHKESCADAKSIRQRNERRARLLSRSSARRNFLVGWEM